MDHSVRVRFKLSLGRVMFWVQWHIGSGRFGSGKFRFESISAQWIFSPIYLSCKNKQLCRKFRVESSSVQVNSSFQSTFGWTYFGCRLNIGLGRSVQILDLRLWDIAFGRIHGFYDPIYGCYDWFPPLTINDAILVMVGCGGHEPRDGKCIRDEVYQRLDFVIELPSNPWFQFIE